MNKFIEYQNLDINNSELLDQFLKSCNLYELEMVYQYQMSTQNN
jgi:hypothetical protein